MTTPSSAGRQAIVVALDGSPLVETALPNALMLAKLPAAEVILLHVIAAIPNVIEDGARIALDEQWDSEKRRGPQYLASAHVRSGATSTFEPRSKLDRRRFRACTGG